MGGFGHDYSRKDTTIQPCSIAVWGWAGSGRRMARGASAHGFGWGRGGGIQRSKDTAIFAPKARSCANWKSHLSFNKVTGRGNLKTVRDVKGKGGLLSVLCVPSRLGKLEGSPLSDAHITLITSSLYKTRSIGMTETAYLFAFHFILLYCFACIVLVFSSVGSERCE